MFRLYLAALFLYFSLVAGTQADSIPTSIQTLHQMYHESWTSRDGAPANIEHVLEGPDGFLWIATDGGMYRFDGSSFERLPLSLPPYHPYLMCRTQDGAMWILWLYGSLTRIKNGHVTTFTNREGLQDNQLAGVVQRNDGSYLIAGRGGLQVLTESADGSLKFGPGLQPLSATSIAEDAERNVWLTTPELLEVKPPGQHEFQQVATGSFFCLASRAPGILCAEQIKEGPVVQWQWRDGRISQHALLDGLTARAFWSTGDGTLWVGAGQGIVRTSLTQPTPPTYESPETEHYAKIDGLSDDSPFQILNDREGSIWVVTSKGLDRFRVAPFTAIDMRQPIPVALAHGEPSRRTIVATDRLVEITTGIPIAVSEQFVRGDWARTLLRTGDDSLWVGTGSGHLYHFSNHHLVPTPVPSLTGSDPILAVAEDSSHSLWISIGAGKGVYRFDGTRWIKSGGIDQLPSDSATNIARDSQGGLWFAYRDNRIAHLHLGNVRTYGTADGLNLGNIKSFAERGREMFVGGELGVAVLSSQRVHSLIVDRPRLQGVTGLAFAPDESLWINTADGVIRVDKSELTTERLTAQQPAATQLFDFHDGLQGVPFPLYADSLSLDAKGRLYVATRELLQWIDPLSNLRNEHEPPVWIRSVTADGQLERYPSGALNLAPNVEHVEIDFTAPSLLIPDRVVFRYKLEGYDKDWVTSGTRRQAFYSKLPPATYTFKVIASNDSGVWNTRGASLSFRVPPTFTQTYAFKLTCLLVMAVVVWILYRLRLMQMSAQLRSRMYARLAERERIARNLHDTFFQAVQGLFLTINSVTKTMSNDDPARRVVEEALSRSDKVMAEGRDLVLDLRGGHIRGQTLPALLSAVGTELSQLTQCKFALTEYGDAKELRPSAADEAYWLGREAISNSFRHSTAKLVEVEVQYDSSELRVRIRDNGVGIDKHILDQGHRHNHWGLPGMRERAKKIGARLDIWSGKDIGTEIEVRIPAGLAYMTVKGSMMTRLSQMRMHRKGREA